jgi:dimethylaniline monooxygenase (N-oxide forming)
MASFEQTKMLFQAKSFLASRSFARARVAAATVNRGGRRALTLASQHTLFQPPLRRETVLLGCVSYDPSVGEIWGQLKSHFVNTGGVPNFDYVLFSNYEQQVRALLDSHIDIAWNGPIAHVMSEERAAVVSLGMRDVDRDFESVCVTRLDANLPSLEGARLLAGASDSPQGYLIPRYYLQRVLNINCLIVPNDVDLGKHGDTATGEVIALKRLMENADDSNPFHGAVLSRMMWNRAIAGLLPPIDAQKLSETVSVNNLQLEMPKFDHCQFDVLESNLPKVEGFYSALHSMDYNDPKQQHIMKLEGIRRSWEKPRQEGYAIVRSALGLHADARAKNFSPGTAKRVFSSNADPSQSSSIRACPLPPQSRVGVIGCGVAGLQVIRSMKARGYEVTCFERANDIGGVWRSNYDGFGLQVGKQFYEMPDLEMTEAEWSELPSGARVQAYIKRFAKHFDLESSVQLNTSVKRITRNLQKDGSRAQPTWTVHTQNGSIHTFDYLVVSTGMYSSDPFLPEQYYSLARETFSGDAIHSSQFSDAQIAKNKRVLVVGGGKSATDCCAASAGAGAKSVTLLQRSSHWPTPLHVAGLIPFQHIFLSRLGQALVEAKVGVYPGARSAASIFRPLMGPIFGIVEMLFAFQFGLRGDLWPKVGVVEDFYGYAQVQDGSFKRLRDSGKVLVKRGEMQEFSPDGVRTKEDDFIETDLVIFATGWKKDYSFFDTNVKELLDMQNDGLYLYKRMLPPAVPGLAFIGSESATIFNCTSSGLQAEWLARTLAGVSKLQNNDLEHEAMAAEVHAFKTFARSWMPPTSSRSGLVLLHQLHYYDQLLRDMGEEPSRKTNIVTEYLGSYYSRDYNGIIGRPVA